MRAATRETHQQFENELAIARQCADKHVYQTFIAAMFGWLSPFEQALWRSSWPNELQAGRRSGKVAWLIDDLQSAGLDDVAIAALPLAPVSVDLQTLAGRFGVAYVLEGSQLGSQVLLKRMAATLAPWPARWLQGYGAETGANWRIFVQTAEKHLVDEAASEIAARAAQQTFLSLHDWFRRRGAA